MGNKLEIVKSECPYCSGVVYANKKVFANHVRWCNENPRYEEIRKSTSKKIIEFNNNTSTRKDRVISCAVCRNEFTVSLTDKQFNSNKYRKTCSDICSKKLTAYNTNKKDKNKKISEGVNNYIQEHGYFGVIKERVGNKEVKLSDYKERTCQYCGNMFISSKNGQRFCSVLCGRKNRNHIDCDTKDLKRVYKLQTAFKFALNDYPDEFDFSLITESGWYKASNNGNNLKGISRDHMFSVYEGFKQKIDPYYISHPANCKLMKHEDNFKKRTDCSISVEELYKRVDEWNNKYGIYENQIDYYRLKDFKK